MNIPTKNDFSKFWKITQDPKIQNKKNQSNCRIFQNLPPHPGGGGGGAGTFLMEHMPKSTQRVGGCIS